MSCTIRLQIILLNRWKNQLLLAFPWHPENNHSLILIRFRFSLILSTYKLISVIIPKLISLINYYQLMFLNPCFYFSLSLSLVKISTFLIARNFYIFSILIDCMNFRYLDLDLDLFVSEICRLPFVDSGSIMLVCFSPFRLFILARESMKIL